MIFELALSPSAPHKNTSVADEFRTYRSLVQLAESNILWTLIIVIVIAVVFVIVAIFAVVNAAESVNKTIR
jgi:uncharacterized integral membrane protein